MSMDYYIYLKQPDGFSVQSFESYCTTLGLCVTIHPSFNLLEDSGFAPMRLINERFAKEGESKAFLSGFELYSSEYQHLSRSPKKKTGFFQKLFKAKPVGETPFDRVTKDASVLLELRCSGADSFEVLLAYVFGAYLVKHCGGVFDDPQTGQYYDNCKLLEIEIAEILTELLQQANKGELLTHEFTEWN